MVKEFYLADRWDPKKVLLHHFRVEQGVMAMKRYSTFLKAPRLEHHQQMFLYHIQDTHWVGEGFHPSEEMQSTYSTSPADKTYNCLVITGHRSKKNFKRCFFVFFSLISPI